MSVIKAVQLGDSHWDVYATERDEFLLSIQLTNLDSEKNTADLVWAMSPARGKSEEYVAAFRFAAEQALFERKIWTLKATAHIGDPGAIFCFNKAGFISGREFGAGAKRQLRLSCDRYDLIRLVAETEMGKHLDMSVWRFGWDSAKRRLGVCKYAEKLISLSRYFVDLHSLDEIHQVILHEVAHAIAGSDAGHGRKWKDNATKLGYRHKKISGDEIGNATAKLIGHCPNGHINYRHRKPKTPLSCGKCSSRFDNRYLITWTSR
jgi:predicted SprT family Zn-dependent metalloprotease